MTTAEKLITAEEFALLPDPPGGEQMELVRGRVKLAPPANTEHGEQSFLIGVELHSFVRQHKLGRVTGEGGYRLATDPDIVRAPDAAFVSVERVPERLPKGLYFDGAPNLAVEVVSPTDKDADIAEKVLDYLACGTERVWVVRPGLRTVTVHRPGGTHTPYTDADTLTSDDAGFSVSGFTLPIAQLFAWS